MLFIHKVRSNEKDVLFQLMKEAGLQTIDWEIFYPTFMLAELDDEIVGMGGIEIYGENAVLRNLYVKEAYRGQLLDDAIVRSLLNLADLRGVKQVYTITQNQLLPDLLGRIGFNLADHETFARDCIESQWVKSQQGQPLVIDLKVFFNTPCQGHK